MFRLTYLLFIYEQASFNFSNMQLEQQTHFLHSLFFIHPAIQNATPQYSTFHERQPGTTIEQFNGIPQDPVFI